MSVYVGVSDLLALAVQLTQNMLESRLMLSPALDASVLEVKVRIRQHASAYVSMRQHTSAYVSIRQHTSAYVSIRQHMSAYVCRC